MKLFMPMMTDSYKIGHIQQYKSGTTKVYSNLTPRHDSIFKRVNKDALPYYNGKLLWVGGAAAFKEINEAWKEEFFNKTKTSVVTFFASMMTYHFGVDMEMAEAEMSALHDLGYLPLEIKELPEGTFVPMNVPVMTMTNTVDRFFWLVNFHETIISSMTWKTATNATIANVFRNIVEDYANETCDDNSHIQFQCHDFSSRGMSGPEDSARSGIGHLIPFKGSDSLGSMYYAATYMAGKNVDQTSFSVPATEHAVATSNIIHIQNNNQELSTLDCEKEFVKNMITNVHPTGIVSLVADSYDFWSVCDSVMRELKDVVMSRDGKVVLRPDSGDPVKVICGDNESSDIREQKGAIEVLWDVFGGKVNEKGYKELDPHIGLIYGDSITISRAIEILSNLKDKGFASNNIVFGVGSFTYQYNTRDTFGFAVKATYSEVVENGVLFKNNIFKQPKTDSKKTSAKGLLSVVKGWGEFSDYTLCQEVSEDQEKKGCLETIFKDGVFTKQVSLDMIRKTYEQERVK